LLKTIHDVCSIRVANKRSFLVTKLVTFLHEEYR
jgi:hypothetical protein